MPHPYLQDDPSNNKVHGRGSSNSIRWSWCWATKSSITCPLTASADSYCKSNYVSVKVHFPILPFKIGKGSIYLIIVALHTTVNSVDRILINKGKLCTLLAYFIYNNLVPHVLSNKWFQVHKYEIRGKQAEDTTEVCRRSHPTSHLQERATWQSKPMYKGGKPPKDKARTHLSVHHAKAVARGGT
jgi:hypothetical protein